MHGIEGSGELKFTGEECEGRAEERQHAFGWHDGMMREVGACKCQNYAPAGCNNIS